MGRYTRCCCAPSSRGPDVVGSVGYRDIVSGVGGRGARVATIGTSADGVTGCMSVVATCSVASFGAVGGSLWMCIGVVRVGVLMLSCG